ncbi:hypothetical protein P2H44_06495 [Albimonas sp. CAU 1670]|uniref:hypothetical protein n=1 Tax=Albimonas sp. CAU 1670 TaxID=3032599 RepID=UPI0023DB261C|nr:hypothetical protein [Albimonas sp. CAU 1670]MDF2232199.1 hypothetical protein [Albimonas sp. CAU 1670]
MSRRTAQRKPQEMTAEERRAAIWAAMRAKGDDDWSVRDITRATDIPRWTVKDLADRLVLAGYAAREEGERGLRFRLTHKAGPQAPRLRADGTPASQGSGQLNMWRSMRVAREFSTTDLAAYSSVPPVVVAPSSAQKYCLRLARAGYLRPLPRRSGSGEVRYVLVRDTGPRPPRIRRDGTLEDPNTGETVSPKTEEAVS